MAVLFGANVATHIANSVHPPDPNTLLNDRMIWNRAKSGVYTVKEGYRMLRNSVHQLQNAERHIWRFIWKTTGLIPQVRLFLWKACQKALPVAQEMHRRIPGISPICARCQEENEYITHLLFFCPSSRATWFASNLAIRVDGLPLDFKQCLLLLIRTMSDEQFECAANLMWNLWKARNAEVIEGKRVNPTRVLRNARSMVSVQNQISQVASTLKGICTVPPGFGVVLVDGSWDTTGKAGIGILAYDAHNRLIVAKGQQVQVHGLFHAEAAGVLEAIRWITSSTDLGAPQGYIIATDCATLAQSVADGDGVNIPEWQAEVTVRTIQQARHQQSGVIKIEHVSREALKGAHVLANWVRRTQTNYMAQQLPLELMHGTELGRFQTEFFPRGVG